MSASNTPIANATLLALLKQLGHIDFLDASVSDLSASLRFRSDKVRVPKHWKGESSGSPEALLADDSHRTMLIKQGKGTIAMPRTGLNVSYSPTEANTGSPS